MRRRWHSIDDAILAAAWNLLCRLVLCTSGFSQPVPNPVPFLLPVPVQFMSPVAMPWVNPVPGKLDCCMQRTAHPCLACRHSI